MKKWFTRLSALWMALLLLFTLTGCGMAADEQSPIETLAAKLQEAQAAFTQAEDALVLADQEVAALEKKYDKNPSSTQLQDQLLDAMIAQEAALDARSEALATLMVLQAQQQTLAEAADCETLLVEKDGKYAKLSAAVTVDENMVIYALAVQVEGSERDQLVGENDYLYQFLGKDIPLTIGSAEDDDVAPLAKARQTSIDLVDALNSLVVQPDVQPAASTDLIIEPQAIADYIFQHGKLPENFITKKEAKALGWDSSRNYVSDVAPGKSIGGDRFGNYENRLPAKQGRTWYEADCYYTTGKRNAFRILYSSDGLVYYTNDHYETFTQLFPSKK